MAKKILILCPWCDKDFDYWQIGSLDGDDETLLPSIGEEQRCQSCLNNFQVIDIEISKISVARGKSKAQEDQAKQESKDEWKRKVKELRSRYLKAHVSSWYCQIFGHSWECLAESAYSDSSLLSKHKFLVCKACLYVIDTLSEDPENYGYWVKL